MSPSAARKGPAAAIADASCELHVLRNVDQREGYREARERVNATGLALTGSFLTVSAAMSEIRIKFYQNQCFAPLVAGFYAMRDSVGSLLLVSRDDKKTPHVVIPCHALFAELHR
ncbi:hypothetical protein [Rhizobium wenxiniae]|uniref:hypothetical protein n=1 Tax=Rhizobium wenxiniae TaxID=1737357 RepID=UPI001C6E3DC8|nr:hypothetical protein [Rhizobium wenxiniae]